MKNPSHPLKIVLTGGGTGGHIYPALAVGEALLKEPSVGEVHYIGNDISIERDIVPQHGLPFHSIHFHGMPRKIGFQWVQWLFELNKAIHEAKKILKAIGPDAVFGTGGYVSAPVLMAASQLKIPYGVHEPDAFPGLVNRTMAKGAAFTTSAFSETQKRLQTKAFFHTGNPLRGNILNLWGDHRISKQEALGQLGLAWDFQKPVLIVLGGSQGARTLNKAIVEALPTLLNELNFQVIHQTGAKLFEETWQNLPEGLKEDTRYCIRPYYEEMWLNLAVSDIALCRSGSLTLSEMYLAGLPTVLVPYPFAAANHQLKNAEASAQAGASVLIEDSACNAETIIKTLQGLFSPSQGERLHQMKACALKLAHPEATETLVQKILGLCFNS
ncbi:MAG: undecaprenyldiphospho-muramoylpentapeptide beta-N-acetylglucosaminyltransferase [Cyanobacteria bacterium]|nr:undecaprenyldiphospho-muramoylpentapeptide beta-N-acetylglucosaminyltransferase [Cyanobacteriota bacterium]